MKILTIPLLIFITLIVSCNTAQTDNPRIAQDYIVITEAIKMSKDSRSAFQDKFAVAIDSFLQNDNSSIQFEDLKRLLEKAKEENAKAELLVRSANEIDSTLKYKEKTLDMFVFLDSAYASTYPGIFKMKEHQFINKKDSILKALVASFKTLKVKGQEVISTAALVNKIYNLNLKVVEK